MPELITPAQSEVMMAVAAVILTVVLAASGRRVAKQRGILLGLLGPLFYLGWRGHVFATRYDPQSGYFGLDKVSVLLLEVALAVVVGVLAGRMWNRMSARSQVTAGVSTGEARRPDKSE